jgi:hypothetical protein
MAFFLMPDGKDTNEVLDYTINMAAELSRVSDTLSSVVWTVPAGLVNVAQSNTTTAATVKLGGGTLGAEYEVSAQMTTAGGRVYNRTFRLQIKDK